MIIRPAAALLALTVIASAQAPAQPPPKPKILAMPGGALPTKPKTRTKPKPKPADAPEDMTELPPAKPVVEQPKRDRGAENSLAAFMPKVKGTLGKGWDAAVQQHAAEFTPGNVSLKFKLDGEGKVAAITITENSSNAAFGKFCEEYVRTLQFEAPPPRILQDGTLEIPFTFWLY